MSNTRIVYQDDQVTEYEDGTEEVRFSDAEWEAMSLRPRYFGLVLQCGHALSHYNAAEGCIACFSIGEELQYCESDEDYAAIEASFPRAPADLEVN